MTDSKQKQTNGGKAAFFLDLMNDYDKNKTKWSGQYFTDLNLQPQWQQIEINTIQLNLYSTHKLQITPEGEWLLNVG